MTNDEMLAESTVLMTDRSYDDIRKSKDQGFRYIDHDRQKTMSVGSDVWIGENISVLADDSLVSNYVIEVNNLILSNVPAPDTVAGVPLKVARQMGCNPS